MAGLELAILEVLLYLLGQVEKAQSVGDGWTALCKPLRHLLLCQVVLIHKEAYSRGFLDRVQVLPLYIFYESHLHHLIVVHILYNYRYLIQACYAGGTVAAFAGYYGVPLPCPAHDDGLYYAVVFYGIGQLVQLFLIKALAGLG